MCEVVNKPDRTELVGSICSLYCSCPFAGFPGSWSVTVVAQTSFTICSSLFCWRNKFDLVFLDSTLPLCELDLHVCRNSSCWLSTAPPRCIWLLTSLRLETQHGLCWFFWFLGAQQMFPLLRILERKRRGRENGSVRPPGLVCADSRDQRSARLSALKARFHPLQEETSQESFPLRPDASRVQQSINTTQVGGTWLCWRAEVPPSDHFYFNFVWFVDFAPAEWTTAKFPDMRFRWKHSLKWRLL